MKIYEEPRIEILKFNIEDIVTTSAPEFDDDNTGEWGT